MPSTQPPRSQRPLRWKSVYSETELCRAAVRVYTKPLFQWRKALSTSTDGKTLYDFAARGLRGLDALHQSLQHQDFTFRPAVALHYNFNGKHRTIYIAPWEERIVDLLLYRMLNHRLNAWFSSNTYAYRESSHGIDHCQTQITTALRSAGSRPLYLVKRDIADYFATVNHELLLSKLSALVDPSDFLFRMLSQRVRFTYQEEDGQTRTAGIGIPFGTAIACLFANIYLTDLDRQIDSVAGVRYFRYADDILLLSPDIDLALLAAQKLEAEVASLRLTMKVSHSANLALSAKPVPENVYPIQPCDPGAFACEEGAQPRADRPHGSRSSARSDADSAPVFSPVSEFRHLGLLFRAGGAVALSRDKLRKIQNLFRFAFRRGSRRWRKIADPQARAQALIAIAAETIDKGLRNVAILDYYLKHVDDESQIRLLDRWLAEEVLASVFGGHKKGHYRRISFHQLRDLGLPSLVHRQRLIRRGCIESPFFIWRREKSTKAFRGTVARLPVQ